MSRAMTIKQLKDVRAGGAKVTRRPRKPKDPPKVVPISDDRLDEILARLNKFSATHDRGEIIVESATPVPRPIRIDVIRDEETGLIMSLVPVY